MNAARVYNAKKNYRCDKCGKEIKIGDSYIWWKPRYNRILRWCASHGEPPKSEKISSPLKRKVYECIEDIVNHLESCTLTLSYATEGEKQHDINLIEVRLKELNNCIKDNSEILRELADKYYDSAIKIRGHFGETEQVIDFIIKGDTIYEWVEYLEMYMKVIAEEIETFPSITINDIRNWKLWSELTVAIDNLESFEL